MNLAGKYEVSGVIVTAVLAKVAVIAASDVSHYAAAFAALCTGVAMLFRARYYHRKK